VLAAYSACCADETSKSFLGKSYRDMLDPDDMQQSYLMERIGRQAESIRGAQVPLDALIHEAYKVVEEQLLNIVNFNFGTGKVALVGGVQINMPAPYQDHFEPLYFKALSRDDPDGIDLMHEFRYSGH